jgi:hypothetical protein
MSMDDQVAWFEWTRDDAINFSRIHRAVIDGGMGLAGMYLIGEFEFGDDYAELKGASAPRLEYTGPSRDDGRYTVEVVGYEAGADPTIYGVHPWRMPERYSR